MCKPHPLFKESFTGFPIADPWKVVTVYLIYAHENLILHTGIIVSMQDPLRYE